MEQTYISVLDITHDAAIAMSIVDRKSESCKDMRSSIAAAFVISFIHHMWCRISEALLALTVADERLCVQFTNLEEIYISIPVSPSVSTT